MNSYRLTFKQNWPIRSEQTHKGQVGKIAVIAGSKKMPGAASLTANAAIQSGAGLVYVFSVHDIFPQLQIQNPTLIGVGFDSDAMGCLSRTCAPYLIQALKDHAIDQIIIGPGLGQSSDLNHIVKEVLEYAHSYEIPVVLDADGLNNISVAEWPKGKSKIVITPHSKEYQRFVNSPTLEHSITDIQNLAIDKHLICVYKGHQSKVIDHANIYINQSGNPGMATAGSGDVLSGVIGAFAAQVDDLFLATTMAVYIHGRAGDQCFENNDIAFTATNILEAIPLTIKKECT